MSQFDTQRKSSIKDAGKVKSLLSEAGIENTTGGSKISALKGKLGGIPMPGSFWSQKQNRKSIQHLVCFLITT